MNIEACVNGFLLPVRLAGKLAYAVLYFVLLGMCRTVVWCGKLTGKLLRGYVRLAYFPGRSRRYGRRSYEVTPVYDAGVATLCLALGIAYVFV